MDQSLKQLLSRRISGISLLSYLKKLREERSGVLIKNPDSQTTINLLEIKTTFSNELKNKHFFIDQLRISINTRAFGNWLYVAVEDLN